MQANAGYTRAAVRGATCHLRLGDFGAAAAMLRASQPHAATPAAAKELADKLQEAEKLQAAYAEVTFEILNWYNGKQYPTDGTDDIST
jgi:arginyl-tRNA synthetase